MNIPPTSTTHSPQPGGINDGGADALWYARAAVKSAADLDDATVAEACRTIINSADKSVGWTERFMAEVMLCLVEGEMA